MRMHKERYFSIGELRHIRLDLGLFRVDERLEANF